MAKQRGVPGSLIGVRAGRDSWVAAWAEVNIRAMRVERDWRHLRGTQGSKDGRSAGWGTKGRPEPPALLHLGSHQSPPQPYSPHSTLTRHRCTCLWGRESVSTAGVCVCTCVWPLTTRAPALPPGCRRPQPGPASADLGVPFRDGVVRSRQWGGGVWEKGLRRPGVTCSPEEVSEVQPPAWVP